LENFLGLTEWELGQIYEALLIAVVSPVCEWLSHEVGIVEAFTFQRFFHQFDRLQRLLSVEVTVGADDMRTCHVQNTSTTPVLSALNLTSDHRKRIKC